MGNNIIFLYAYVEIYIYLSIKDTQTARHPVTFK